MTFIEKIKVIERVDRLISLKATGTACELSHKLGLSRRAVFDLLNLMKEMGAPIKFCNSRRSYFYTSPCTFVAEFIEDEG